MSYRRRPAASIIAICAPGISITLLSLFLFGSCRPGSTIPEADIRTAYVRYVQSVQKMDVPAYMSVFATDFSMRSPDGRTHDRAEMEKYQRINAQTTKKVSSYTADIQAITYPSDSEVAVIVLQKYDRDQAPLEDPQHAHRIQTSAVQREIWRKTASGLKIRKIEEILTGPVFIDGKALR
jgi:hypothetical protein